MPQLWYANIDKQFILDAYVVASYCSSYMTKQDMTLSFAFHQIQQKCTYAYNEKMQFIKKLGNALLNYQ